MFHIYLLVGCMTVGVICLVAYELDQQVQANQRRREYEQRQQRMAHSYATPPRFKEVEHEEEAEGKSSAVQVVGHEKMTMGTDTGLYERRRSTTTGATGDVTQEGSDHHQNLRPTLSSPPLDSCAGSAFLSDSGTLSGSPPSSADLTSHSHPTHSLTPNHGLPKYNTNSDRQIFTRHSRHNSFSDDSDSSASNSATEPLFEQRAAGRMGATSPDADWVRL